MREFIVENLTSAETISFAVIVLNNLVAMAAAFFVMLAYKVTYSGTAYSRKFNISLGAITIITTMIMSVISNNIALSLGMVGALSIIRFRTAVKDVEMPLHFLGDRRGIGCGVSQYLLIGVGSVFLLLFLLLTKNVVSSGKQLMVVRGRPEAQNQIEAVVSGHFDGKAHLNVKNLSAASCELVYSIREGDLAKANEKNMIDIAQRLMKLEGVERVNLVEQQDDISR